ncbi:hypothetical protein [Zoogloea sp.]|uniref:hypothetical protein n=1 Tax=Zoogloea sp. TaxID=49181 RepID=UPI002631709B|nr:hypothetical protein [Zoogloea sp.]MDD3353323.1 hypothetical protein [Zoogloea sp.]
MPMDATGDLQLLEGIPVRPGTKLASLAMALRRPQGATKLQLMLATGMADRHTASHSCIHAGMSRWPCSTRQTSM